MLWRTRFTASTHPILLRMGPQSLKVPHDTVLVVTILFVRSSSCNGPWFELCSGWTQMLPLERCSRWQGPRKCHNTVSQILTGRCDHVHNTTQHNTRHSRCPLENLYHNGEFVRTHQCFKIRHIIARQYYTNMWMSVKSTAKMSLIVRIIWRLFLRSSITHSRLNYTAWKMHDLFSHEIILTNEVCRLACHILISYNYFTVRLFHDWYLMILFNVI
jgi:hypothetical protein